MKTGCAEKKIDLVAQSERAWIGLIAGRNHLLAEALARELRKLKQDIGGPSPPALERLLVDRLVLHWLQTVYADVSFAEWASNDVRQRSHVLHRMDAANRWLVAAIQALMQVRQMVRRPAARPLRQTIMRRHRQPWPSRRLPRQVVRSSPLTHLPVRPTGWLAVHRIRSPLKPPAARS